MYDTFLYALRAILPILLLIALGMAVRRLGSWDVPFFKRLNKLCFQLFLPIQLFCNIYQVNDLADVNWRLVLYLAVGVVGCVAMGLLLTKLTRVRREQRGVLVQAAFRSNQTILGLPLAQSLGGDAALGFASVATSVCVPMYNFLAVLVLTWFSHSGDKPSLREVGRRVVTNPLILGALSGLVCVALRGLLPVVDGQPVFTIQNQLPSVYRALSDLSRVASPVMLFVLGTTLDFKAIRGLLPQLVLGLSLRLVLAPALVIGTALLMKDVLGVGPVEMPTFVAVCASPVAVSSSVMVQEIGGDDQLAGQLVVWSSALSMLTMFLLIFLLRAVGVL